MSSLPVLFLYGCLVDVCFLPAGSGLWMWLRWMWWS